jgi:hypothetical protein
MPLVFFLVLQNTISQVFEISLHMNVISIFKCCHVQRSQWPAWHQEKYFRPDATPVTRPVKQCRCKIGTNILARE